MLHKEIPFLRIVLPFCAGIIAGLYFKPDAVILLVASVISLPGFLTIFLRDKQQNNLLFGLSLSIVLFTCGLLLYSHEKSSLSDLKPEPAIFSCTLSDFPAEKQNSFMLTVRLKSRTVGNRTETIKGSMLLYHKKDTLISQLLPGDMLTIICTPVRITNRGNPYEFNYSFYMENQGIRYYAFTNSRNIISHVEPQHRKLIHKALIIREKIISMYKARGITGERLALVAAMTLGQRNLLDPEQKQNFIKAGVMHVMAVSGLHAVILSWFVFSLLFFMKRRFNILRILITMVILWSFAFVTGLTPSVLRATLMFSFLQAGNLMNRRVNGINSVLASAFVLILIKPSVIFDAGFLLSYSAVIFIISFYQDLYLKLRLKNWFADKLWQSAVVTIVAQAGTLPLTIMLFNRFPTYFIITNLIIVPLSSLLIIVGCTVPMFFPVLFLSKFLAQILNYLTGLTEVLTAFASSLPGSTIENIGMTTAECLLLCITIYLFTLFLLKKQSVSFIYPLILLLLYASVVTITEISTKTTNELIVYNTQGSSSIGLRTGKTLNLYADTSVAAPEVLKHCATLGLNLKINTLCKSSYYLRVGNKSILICNGVDNTPADINPDIMIITALKSEIAGYLPFKKSPGSLIISAGLTSGNQIQNQQNLSGIDTIHFIRKSGAFTERL